MHPTRNRAEEEKDNDADEPRRHFVFVSHGREEGETGRGREGETDGSRHRERLAWRILVRGIGGPMGVGSRGGHELWMLAP